MLRKEKAGNLKLQSSINEALVCVDKIFKKESYATTVASSMKKIEELQSMTKQKNARKVSSEMEHKQWKNEMDEDEKIRKLQKSFEAMEGMITIGRNM